MSDGKGAALVQLLDNLHKKSGLKVDTVIETGDKISVSFNSNTDLPLFHIGYYWTNNKWKPAIIRSHTDLFLKELTR